MIICCPPGELVGCMIGVDNQTVPTQGDEVQLRAETHPDTFIDDRIVFLILGRYYPKFAPGVQMNNVGQVMTSGEMLWRDNETNYISPSFQHHCLSTLPLRLLLQSSSASIWMIDQLCDVFLISISRRGTLGKS